MYFKNIIFFLKNIFYLFLLFLTKYAFNFSRKIFDYSKILPSNSKNKRKIHQIKSFVPKDTKKSYKKI